MWAIHDGPPFASGKPHLGHLYNKTLKDIINRYKLLQGYQVHFVNGFDCYGTVIEDLALNQDLDPHNIEGLQLSLNNSKAIDKYTAASKEEKDILK